MNFFRQYVIPFVIIAMFLVALIAVVSRAFLPSDLAAPAPVIIDEVGVLSIFE